MNTGASTVCRWEALSDPCTFFNCFWERTGRDGDGETLIRLDEPCDPLRSIPAHATTPRPHVMVPIR